MWFGWILAVSTCCIPVSSLLCYVCSEESWNKCNQNLRIFNCSHIPSPEPFDTCLKQHMIKTVAGPNRTKTLSSFSKMCTQSLTCSRTEEYCKSKGYYCRVECCTTDLCNGARSVFQEVSGLVCMACLLLLFFLDLNEFPNSARNIVWGFGRDLYMFVQSDSRIFPGFN